MSGFQPTNDDHAIEGVVFQLIFDAPLAPAIIPAAQGRHSEWSEELPAQYVGPLSEDESPSFLTPPGIAFSYLRPDGSPAWQLRFEGAVVTVSSTRYTRWARVWGTAASYLRKATHLIRETTELGPRRIARMRLQVTDRFSASEKAYRAADLLGRSKHIPAAIFDLGPVWHSNTGWFDTHNNNPILENLNLVASREPDSEGDQIINIAITHAQELRFTTPLTLEDGDALWTILEQAMANLHSCNKDLISELLVPSVADRIGLNASRVLG